MQQALTVMIRKPVSLLLVLGLVACGGSDPSSADTGDEQDITSRNKAVTTAVEDDVHAHAKARQVTKIADALGALTADKSAQAAVKDAVTKATPAGASAPYFGTVHVKSSVYLWADFETDEGEGPTKTGTTIVFDRKGAEVVKLDWTGAHGY